MSDEKKATSPAQVEQGRKRSVGRNIFFAIAAVVLVFTFLEIATRILGFDSWQVDFGVYKGKAGDITPNQSVRYRFGNFDHSYTININDQGLRAPSRVRDERPFRVLCVGDSSTLGFGVEDHETYPAQLQAFLDGRYPGIFDVINAGVVGYTIDDELEYLLEKGFALEPDIVILEVFWNDALEKSIRPKSSQREYSKRNFPYTIFRSIILNSAFYQWMRNHYLRWAARHGDFPELPTDRLNEALEPQVHHDLWDPYDEQFKRLVNVCKDSNVALIVMITPHQTQVYDWGYPVWDFAGSTEFEKHFFDLLGPGDGVAVGLLKTFREEKQLYRSLYLSNGLYDEHLGPHGQWVKAREAFKAIEKIGAEHGLINIYNSMLENRLAFQDLSSRPGRLWRAVGDNGGVFMADGSVLILENNSSSDKFRFASSIAAIGERNADKALHVVNINFENSLPEYISTLATWKFPTDDTIKKVAGDFSITQGSTFALWIGKEGADAEQFLKDFDREWGYKNENKNLKMKRRNPNFFIMQPIFYPDGFTSDKK